MHVGVVQLSIRSNSEQASNLDGIGILDPKPDRTVEEGMLLGVQDSDRVALLDEMRGHVWVINLGIDITRHDDPDRWSVSVEVESDRDRGLSILVPHPKAEANQSLGVCDLAQEAPMARRRIHAVLAHAKIRLGDVVFMGT